MSEALKAKWNARYVEASDPGEPTDVLAENAHLLPQSGTALDLACGMGGDALFLAGHGLETWAWDIADVAIEKLATRVRNLNLPVHAEVRDVEAQPPAPEAFDVIVVSRFLARALAPAIIAALKPGGLLFYQTFTRTKAEDIGPGNPDFLLAENELLQMFAPLRLVVYREELDIGDTTRGFRNEAMLVARK